MTEPGGPDVGLRTELPPIGEVPERMLAQVVRRERFGEPVDAFWVEEIPTPDLRPDEVPVAVMAAGISFNNVWAARGIPVDVIAQRRRAGEEPNFHVGGVTRRASSIASART